ncbi:hypothetical protein L2E82_26024 [Cichorium intybus]|uniref:Uncharacterized protein n=1 Tax=Cichorium intybus TaxID=13427 RepID=A0ACB9E4T4_CICIN|nr:hypothetical protein L2E82_26024 [Cichorium intybus]
MEGQYDLYRKGSSGWSYTSGYEEFQETDVWSVLNQRNDFDSKSMKSKGSSSPSFTSRSIPLSTAARMIPRHGTNNLDMESRTPQQQSAPVGIPDWSKIYGKSKSSSQNSPWLDYGDDDDGRHNGRGSWDSDDDNGNMMPPHEWIAQKLARSQISSFSVCEGAGRTLKGRDLSRVRNAVLTKTGFLE